MDVDLDGETERLAKRQYRIAAGTQFSYYAVWFGAPLIGVVAADILVAFGIFTGIYVLGSLPVLRIRSDNVLSTRRTVDEVRSVLWSPANPASIVWFATADEVREPGSDATESTVAVVTHSSFGFSREVPIAVTELDEETVEVRWGGDTRGAMTTVLSVEPTDEGTMLHVTRTSERRRPRHLLATFLASPFEPALLDHLGYRVVESGFSVGIGFR